MAYSLAELFGWSLDTEEKVAAALEVAGALRAVQFIAGAFRKR